MKSKRLIVLLSVLIFITVLIVINSTLFTLQDISVSWLTTKYQLQSVKDYQLVESVEKGQSIFLVKKDEITKQLEKENPYLRVVSIETKFPNKLVVYTAERESLYAIKLSDSEYAVLDERGKVLELTNGSIFEGAGTSFGTMPIKVNFNNLSLRLEDFVVGEQVGVSQIESLLSSLSRSLRESNYIPTTSKGVLKTIDVVSTGDFSEISMQTRSGIVLRIKEIEEYTTDKLLLGFARYNALHKEGVVDCLIDVWYSEGDNKIISSVVW